MSTPNAICQNRKAYHDYFIEETVEAGLKDSYARIMGEEAFLINAHISRYERADGFEKDGPERTRKLLLHKKEIIRLIGKTREKGYTLIPTKMYFKEGRVKVELGLAKGKTFYDKRETIKKRDAEKEIAKAVKSRRTS
ncbi:MAG: SsrA-binding protein SmpB [Deltaproteobacteria bacterium]|nr:SsrA-binding protein SmpB [Deltaproteobacteria bacterium]